MAFRYLIYRTDYGNTVVRENPTDTSTGGTEQSLYTDFVIPEIQPLYLWRITGATTVIPNTDNNINDWIDAISPPPEPEDNATIGYVTGITDSKIDKVTGATGNVGTFTVDGNLQDSGYSISELTGSTTGGTPLTLFNSYTGVTETRLLGIEGDVSSISATTETNELNIATVSGISIQNSLDITTISADTEQNTSDIATVSAVTNNKIDKVTGATGNVGTFTVDGNLQDSGYSISELTGSTTGGTPIELFTGYTATTDNRLDIIESEINYISGITDTKLDISDFVNYSAITDNRLDVIESDIIYLSGQTDLRLTISAFNLYTGTTETRLQGIESDITGLTVNKLNITDFNSYTGVTETRLLGVESDIASLSATSSQAITGATNGLTKVGQNVRLGGILTQDTVISGTTYDFTINSADIVLQATGTIDIIDTSGAGIDVETDGGIIDLIGNTSLGVERTKISISETSMTITDSRSTPTGIQYAANYASTFVNESLVTKRYVDSVATGLIPKANVQVTTNTDIDLSGGTFGGTIDGKTVLDGWRVLVKDQTNGYENGIYVYSGGSNTFYRSSDFDGTPEGEVTDGNIIPVTSGATQYNTVWILVTPNPITIDVTDLEFTLFSQPHELIPGIGINVSGNTISVNGTSLAGSSITWSGNTFNVNPNIGNLANALLLKLNVVDFNSYSATTDTRIDNVEADIVSLSAETANKLEITDFNLYTGNTDTRLNDIEADITSLSAETATKLDTDIFTGYTASTAVKDQRIQLVATGATDINTVTATAIDWHISQYSGSSYLWSGGSGIFIQEDGDYKISYKIGVRNGSGTAVRSVGAYIILNNSSTIVETAGAATVAGGTNISEAITSPEVILPLSANDRLDLAGFRIGNTGTVNTVNESVLILIQRIS